MTDYYNLHDNEVSRLIAEKVMGFEHYSDGNPDHFWVPNPMGGIPATIKHGERWNFPAGVLVFDPANDPVAVFGPDGVVEKLMDNDIYLEIDNYQNPFYRVLARKISMKGDYNLASIEDESITRAVCLAALEAMEKSNEIQIS